MIIREVNPEDKPEIDRIYEKFYNNNEYPDLFNTLKHNGFQQSFVISDNTDKIIVAGGVKNIAEVVVVTDKDLSPRVRLDALLQALGSSIIIAKAMNYNEIHVFVNNDDNYVGILQKFGFKLMDAKLLILNIGESNGQTETA